MVLENSIIFQLLRIREVYEVISVYCKKVIFLLLSEIWLEYHNITAVVNINLQFSIDLLKNETLKISEKRSNLN